VSALTSQSPRSLQADPADEALEDLILERSHDVLWSLSPGGVVLHHVKRGSYLELDGQGYRLWGYLDGARRVSAAIDAASERESVDLISVVATLFANNFVVERAK
jgi:hypothetical protein